MSYQEFTRSINLDDLTPRELIKALQQIPEDYQDDYLHISVRSEYPDLMEISMVIDDAEEARKKWREGNPDYCLFMWLSDKS